MIAERICRICEASKSASNFGKYKVRGKVLIRRTCNSCRRKAEAIRYASNPAVREKAKETARNHHFKKSYGITVEDVARMVEAQDNKCALCQKIFTSPNVDHCHSTGVVRGLLCWDCNIGLGKFRDDVATLKRAVNYLGG